METKVNFRVTEDGEVVAVFMGVQRNNKYLCFSLYYGMHFDADKIYLKECKPARGYNMKELCAYLYNRGYTNIRVCDRMVYDK